MSVLPVGAVGAALSSAGIGGGTSSAVSAVERTLGGSSAAGGSTASNATNRLNLSASGQATGAFSGSALEGVEGGGRLSGVEGAGGAAGLGGATGVEGAGGLEGVGGSAGSEGTGAGEGAGGGGFGAALTHAISSLEATQQSSDGAAQALATGTAGNPEGAVVTVEDAQLAMQLASQVRTKAVEAVQQIFQTQV